MKTVLIIEDSLISRRYIKRGIGSEYNVIEASDGEKGLVAAISQKPDCILCDLLMPVMDGFQFLENLKEKGLQIPVIIITSDIDDTIEEQCLSLGAVALLNKPVNAEEMQEAIRKALGSGNN